MLAYRELFIFLIKNKYQAPTMIQMLFLGAENTMVSMKFLGEWEIINQQATQYIKQWHIITSPPKKVVMRMLFYTGW